VPDGTPAFAAHSGTVLSAERIATGYRIWIQGEGFCTGYFHLSAMLIARGRNVMAGTPIGIIGNNPIDTDPNHLHFEMIRGAFIDYPLNLIDPEPHLPEVA
jgi:murein DD-endopeptidase MepM/ murein hydrolase activator NlpD